MRKSKHSRGSSGQALIETALILPLLLMLLLNALNFGYFYFIVLNTTASPRSGILYSIIGPSSPAATNYPPACAVPNTTPTSTAVYYLAQQDLQMLTNSASNATIQVCSAILGTNGSLANQKANCVTYTPGTGCGSVNTGTSGDVPDADPEAPSFVLQRVDVTYKFAPLIPGTPFNLALLSGVCNAGGTQCTFHRFAEMRGM